MKKSVLIVDDEYGLAEVVAAILSDEGYDAAIALNGSVGLQHLETHPVDLVMMDVMMPVLDGAEMLTRMRRTSAFADVPVIMMTALPASLPDDDPPRFQATLIKPFSHTQMLETIRRLIG